MTGHYCNEFPCPICLRSFNRLRDNHHPITIWPTELRFPDEPAQDRVSIRPGDSFQ